MEDIIYSINVVRVGNIHLITGTIWCAEDQRVDNVAKTTE